MTGTYLEASQPRVPLASEYAGSGSAIRRLHAWTATAEAFFVELPCTIIFLLTTLYCGSSIGHSGDSPFDLS